MSHYQNGSLEKRYKITFSIISFVFANGFQVEDMQNFRDIICDFLNEWKSIFLSNWVCYAQKTICYSVTDKIWKCPTYLGESR